MKIIIIFMLASVLSFSQNVEPFQRQFMYYGTSQFLSSSHDSLKLNKFQLGWHWGDESKITKTLFMNQRDMQSDYPKSKIPDNTLLYIRSVFYEGSNTHILHTHCAFDNNPVFGKSLSYDPTVTVNPNNVYELNIREEDPQNPIFGFLYKRGKVLSNPSDPNYSRLIIDSSSLENQVILSDPWPSRMI
jgi:hypothetical protein